jgi:hypothetical protein
MYVKIKHRGKGLAVMINNKMFPPSYTTEYLRYIYRQVFKEDTEYNLEYIARATMYIWNNTQIGPKPRSREAIEKIVRNARNILECGIAEPTIKNYMY